MCVPSLRPEAAPGWHGACWPWVQVLHWGLFHFGTTRDLIFPAVSTETLLGEASGSCSVCSAMSGVTHGQATAQLATQCAPSIPLAATSGSLCSLRIKIGGFLTFCFAPATNGMVKSNCMGTSCTGQRALPTICTWLMNTASLGTADSSPDGSQDRAAITRAVHGAGVMACTKANCAIRLS